MKKTYIVKTATFIVILLLLTATLSALDFDVALNAQGGLGNSDLEEIGFDYKIGIVPRLFILIDDNSELVVTAGLTIDNENGFVPELLHTEYTRRFGNSSLRLGRFSYSDPLSFIFSGLFDGAQFFNVSPLGIFSAGAWYTGLIYKNTTIIEMTKDERVNNSNPLDYNSFTDTYFAPRRLALSVGWEHPSLWEFTRLNTALIAQFDLNGNNDDSYNSQYLILKASIPFNNFTFELGGSIESVIRKTNGITEPLRLAFAGEAGVLMLFPGEFNSALSLNMKIAGGRVDDICDAFVPITTKYYGYILKHKMSGLSVLSLNYSNRLNRDLGMSLNAMYFVRNDLGTFDGYPLISGNNSSGHFLGAEFSGRLIWSPVSDIQLNLSCGVFIPALGNAEPEQKVKWNVDLSAVFAF